MIRALLRTAAVALLLWQGSRTRTPDMDPDPEVEVDLEEAPAPAIPEVRELGRTSTSVAGPAARLANIARAAALLDGTTVVPGGRLSFNSAVGPRTAERGFAPAPEILMGEVQDGVGGGVCQVSSTVFGAAVRAGMEVVERRSHSRLPDYVRPGWDAMVALGDPSRCSEGPGACSDLVLRNPRARPVVLRVSVERKRLTASFVGEGEPAKASAGWVELERHPHGRKVFRIPGMPEGTRKIKVKGRDAVTGYLSVSAEGLPRRNLVSIYRRVEEVVEAGPGSSVLLEDGAAEF